MDEKIVMSKNDGPRGYKTCQCCVCGIVARCTHSFDFYVTEDHGDGLVCERCFAKYVSRRIASGSDES